MYKSVIKILSVLLITLLFNSAQAYAASYDNKGMDIEFNSQEQIEKEVEKYLIVINEQLYFNIEKAKANKASEDIINIGHEINKISQYNNTSKNSNYNYRSNYNASIGLPLWGNWCGPGHGGGNPQDKLDSLCMSHDECYGRDGYFSCKCDEDLVNGINNLYDSMGKREKIMAIAVKTYFKYSLCKR
ncbi:hypothetical protein [Macrococcoides caseolyticum]|uniref:hypothetical protein n=1 Tax=Macrococcoides caseolyticum TaxID=69966 RepID=UPI001F462A96|nr:hypothetical protein [Macrococcus caseolyticus]MCE4957825.1 hypothetical protein [Macrococcus caseolyticus]